MKKPFLTLPLVLMLLIIFVRTHSTNVTDKEKTNPTYAVWALQPRGVANLTFPPITIYLLQFYVSETLFSETYPLSTMGINNLPDFIDFFNTENEEEHIECYANSGFICLAYVLYNTGMFIQGTVVQIQTGEFAHFQY